MESEERTKQERESRVSVSSLPGLRVGFEMRNMYEKCMLLAVAVFCATVSVGVAKAQEKEGTSLMKPEEKTIQEQESHVRVSSPPGLRVGNDVVSIGISDRTAGAVCSLIYDGMEFVDDYDHGRQFQVAWSYERDIVDNELYNPTEGALEVTARNRHLPVGFSPLKPKATCLLPKVILPTGPLQIPYTVSRGSMSRTPHALPMTD